jgi:hypothetical protein
MTRDGKQPAVSAPAGQAVPSSRDSAGRRRTRRVGRERGCAVYIPADELVKAGIDPYGPPPYARVWGAPRGRVVVQLYKEK